jgi:hypothetical protein
MAGRHNGAKTNHLIIGQRDFEARLRLSLDDRQIVPLVNDDGVFANRRGLCSVSA